MVARHIPHLAFQLDDISHLRDEELARRALGLAPTLVLWALRDARRPGGIERSMPRWARAMQSLIGSASGAEALLTIFRYLSLVVQDLSPQTILSTLAAAPQDQKDALMTTLAERWQAEGEARGEARGRTEGERLLLLSLLERKSGPLPGAERARVAAASEDQVLRWSSRLFDANSLGALLAD